MKNSHPGVLIELDDCTHHTDFVFNGAFEACFATLETLPQLKLSFVVALTKSAAIRSNSTPRHLDGNAYYEYVFYEYIYLMYYYLLLFI